MGCMLSFWHIAIRGVGAGRIVVCVEVETMVFVFAVLIMTVLVTKANSLGVAMALAVNVCFGAVRVLVFVMMRVVRVVQITRCGKNRTFRGRTGCASLDCGISCSDGERDSVASIDASGMKPEAEMGLPEVEVKVVVVVVEVVIWIVEVILSSTGRVIESFVTVVMGVVVTVVVDLRVIVEPI